MTKPTNEQLQEQLNRIAEKVTQFSELKKAGGDLLELVFTESLDGMIISLLKSGEIISANPAAHQMLGYPLGSLVGEVITNIYVPNWELQDDEISSDFTRGPVLLNQAFLTRHSVTRLFDITTNMVLWKESAATLFTLRDAQERLRAESKQQRLRVEALDAVRMKSAFLATMSHEIRTPLNGIIGMSELMHHTHLSELQKEYVNTIRTCGENLLSLINDILDYSKFEAGKLELDPVEFDLRIMLEETLDIVSARAHQKGLDLVLQMSPAVSRNVRTDRMRLQQVLLNLVSNAVKFTAQGFVVLHVEMLDSTSTKQGTSARYKFSIIDSGIGIQPQAIQSLFTPFSQADSSVTRQYGGTGLGLAICKKILDGMQGVVRVMSQPGQGTTFTVELDLQIIRDQTLQETRLRRVPLLYSEILVHAPDMPKSEAAYCEMIEEFLGKAFRLNSSEVLVDYLRLHPTIRLIMLTVEQAIKHQAILVRWLENHGNHLLILTRHSEEANLPFADNSSVRVLRLPVRRELLFAQLSQANHHPIKSGTQRMETSPAEKQFGVGFKLLVVEDDAINRRVASLMLERVGYEIVLAENGRVGLEQLEKGTFHAVLMDCQMPVMDGFTATRMIRESERHQQKHQLVIAMTANAMEGDRERCLEAGFDDYIRKPVQAKELYDVLESHLNALDNEEYQTLSKSQLVNAEQEVASTYFQDEPLYTSKPLRELKELVGEADESLIIDMIQALKKELPEVLAKMKTSLVELNYDQIGFLAHQYESRFGNAGLRRLQALCHALQTDWKKRKTEKIPQYILELDSQADESIHLVSKDWGLL